MNNDVLNELSNWMFYALIDGNEEKAKKLEKIRDKMFNKQLKHNYNLLRKVEAIL